MAISLAPFETFLPIISFLFVFLVTFALLKKTQVLGDNAFTSTFLSLFIASIFIINSRLVEFVQLTTSWAVVLVICLFLILMFVGFAGKDAFEVFVKNKNVAWALVVLMIVVFVVASSYVFNWAINWDLIQSWFDKEWFGMVVILILAAAISKVITK